MCDYFCGKAAKGEGEHIYEVRLIAVDPKAVSTWSAEWFHVSVMPHVMEVGHCEKESSNFISFEGDVVLEWCLLAWYPGDEWGAIKVEESFTILLQRCSHHFVPCGKEQWLSLYNDQIDLRCECASNDRFSWGGILICSQWVLESSYKQCSSALGSSLLRENALMYH